MAYIFHQDQLPRLEGASGGRVRTFFVNKELTNIDDMLAGVMTYTKGTASPFHYHEICEHFYFIMEGQAQVETPEGIQPVGPGMMVFIPAEQKHRLRALDAAVLLRISGARTASRPTSSTARRRISSGIAWTAASGSRRRRKTTRRPCRTRISTRTSCLTPRRRVPANSSRSSTTLSAARRMSSGRCAGCRAARSTTRRVTPAPTSCCI